MPITVSGTSITFNDSTTQTTAFTGAGGVTSLNGQTGAITTTNIDSIGTTIVAVHAVTASGSGGVVSINQNDTVAGSSLRYSYNASNDPLVYAIAYSAGSSQGGNVNIAYNQGGTAPGGTWRCVGRRAGTSRSYDGDANRTDASWSPGIFVRIS